jgi:hypothetical protein
MTSRPRESSGALRLAANDEIAAGIGSPRVPACCLVRGLLLGNCFSGASLSGDETCIDPQGGYPSSSRLFSGGSGPKSVSGSS